MVPDGVRAARSVGAPREVARRAPKKTRKNARRRNGKRRFGSCFRVRVALKKRFFGFFAFREDIFSHP